MERLTCRRIDIHTNISTNWNVPKREYVQRSTRQDLRQLERSKKRNISSHPHVRSSANWNVQKHGTYPATHVKTSANWSVPKSGTYSAINVSKPPPIGTFKNAEGLWYMVCKLKLLVALHECWLFYPTLCLCIRPSFFVKTSTCTRSPQRTVPLTFYIINTIIT